MTLRHPASWEVTRLDRDQLLWSEGAQATLEMRWALYRGRFDADRALRRFGRRARRKGLPRPEPWSVPQSWRTNLSRFRVAGFSWRRAHAQGYGLLTYCPQCRRQSLIQFHPHLLAQPDHIPMLLASMRDHASREGQVVSLFGIRARLPDGARLLRFRFETGRYHLHWRSRRHQIGLFRWAPAGVILARHSLAVFAARQFQIAATDLTPSRRGDAEGVDGGWTSGIPLPARFEHYRLRRILRVWHLASYNCLLGVEVNGRGKGLTSLVEQLCESYASF